MSQSVFRTALLDPAHATPPGLLDRHGTPATRRFAVYRNNVAVSLTAALETGFPVLRRVLGEEFFAAMAGVFLRMHPPTSPVLMFYGAQLPDFLHEFPPVAHLPYLPDLARLELALRQSYHAADAAPLPAATLAGLSAERFLAARLRLAPALRLIRSPWPVFSIWRANSVADAPPPRMAAESLLVLRPDFDPEPHLLTPAAGSFLAALLAGEPVAQALTAAGPQHDLAATLALLRQGGGIVGLVEDDL
ncbi:HvfC/BufC N-terminal domain-containing protein [Rhodobacter ferrooxidans]|uniref:Putative DNA-binding domain-containing protein n=1 Tax=Rhodobacter ferrooxidans TaxID=371731 RepID=C8S0Z7_9RHOB|nr:DNA-binding domain-containing protein [Rhodobacter sp. SW2]EEW25438.1 conserved hypothetical protein [Rhodobacter sp. SW2]